MSVPGWSQTLLDTLLRGTRIFDFVGQQDAKTDHTELGATNRLRGLRAFKFSGNCSSSPC